MQKIFQLFIISTFLIFGWGCILPVCALEANVPVFQEQQVARSVDLAKALMHAKDLRCETVTREQLFKDVYKYSYILKTGPGEHDRVGLYRVIKEKKPFIPVCAPKAVFFIHGDYSAFNLFITQSAVMPQDHSIGIYLAQKGIDVWGIDLRWALLPDEQDEQEDFSFMEAWNTETHLGDIRKAVKLARVLRGFSGSGFGKIILSGFSRGVQYVYAYADAESQLSESLQDLKGIIPMDAQYKADPQSTEIIEAAEGRYAALQAMATRGDYCSDEGIGLKYMAMLALTSPDDDSEVIPGFTNKGAVLLLAAATFATFVEPEGPYTPAYHFTGGMFDEYDLPVDLSFTPYDFLLDVIFNLPGYQSIGEMIDGEVLLAGIGDSPYDDHLSDITIPVFYVGATGGEGEYGVYTLSLLGSTDKTSLVVSLYPEEYIVADFGHLDLLSATDADILVWEPVYNWISSH